MEYPRPRQTIGDSNTHRHTPLLRPPDHLFWHNDDAAIPILQNDRRNSITTYTATKAVANGT